MPKYYRVTTSMMIAGDPNNHATNTYYFADLGDSVTRENAIIEIMARFTDFYGALDNYLISAVDNPHVIIFDMGEPEPRVPISDVQVPLFTTAGATLPAEVAVCLSYRGTYASGDNRRRMRGRVFLGPLKAGTGDGATNFPLKVGGAFTGGSALDMAEALYTPILQPLTWVLRSVADNSYVPITHFAVNTDWDTMRSRQPSRVGLLNWRPIA